MVVVDATISERYCRSKYNQDINQRRQQLLEHDAAADIAISNFCPRLHQAVVLLSRHKVGPLQLKVHLSDFQSSTVSSSPTDGSNVCVKPLRYDRFVLALPYFSEDISTVSGQINLVRWSIIAQCGRPDKVPEVILLGVDDLSIDSGDASVHRSQSNQRSQNYLRRHQTHQIVQERFWQQYVASDGFYLPCLSKWNKTSNDGLLMTQYCVLADQLYECYGQFQFYKLKTSLKPVSSLQPLPQLSEAYNQYKQLAKLSKSSAEDMDTVTTTVSIELLVELEDSIIAKEYDDRRKQKISSGIVRMRVIISLVPIDQSVPSPCSTDSTNQNKKNEVLHLALVNTTFPPSVTPGNSHKNSPKPGNNNPKNKYVVKILNSNYNTNQQQDMIVSMLETASDPVLDTSMIDFVTYVRRVQHFAVKLYNCEMEVDNKEKPSADNNFHDSIEMVLGSLFKMFCDSPSNGNCLLDYHISHDNSTNKTSFIRFLLVDEDIDSETTQLKYILTIEFSKEVFSKLNSSTNEENIDQEKTKTLVPVVALRSVYDDENREYYLNIEIADNVTDEVKNEENNAIHDEIAKSIKTATINAMRQLRLNVLTPVLTRYSQVWSPTDPYFVRSSQKPPSYPSK